MKRDWDLYRTLILHVEEHADVDGGWIEVPISLTAREATDHIIMLEKDGMIEVQDCRNKTKSTAIFPTNLTARGRDFCELSRVDSTWSATLSAISKKTGTVTLGMLIQKLSETNDYLLNKN